MTNQRVEVITSVERRRRWSEAEKRAILVAAAASSMSAAARQASVATSLLYRWRRQFGMDGMALPGASAAFAPVRIVPEAAGAACPGTIEIELASGTRIRVSGAVDATTVSAVIAALAGGRR